MSTTITISTTPALTPARTPAMTSYGVAPRSSLVGVVARVAAGLVGLLLGLAIGLVSAGFDTTRLLLALGGVALGLGWLIALITSAPVTSRGGR